MKKLTLSILMLVLVYAFLLTGCNDAETTEDDNSNNNNEEQTKEKTLPVYGYGDELVGCWVGKDIDGYEVAIQFFSNGNYTRIKCSYSARDSFWGDIASVSGTWYSEKDGALLMISHRTDSNYYGYVYDYEISEEEGLTMIAPFSSNSLLLTKYQGNLTEYLRLTDITR